MKNLPADITTLDKPFLDELLCQFLVYCSCLDNDELKQESFGPMMSTWRYRDSSPLVAGTGDAGFLTLWNYIVNSRSLKDDSPFADYVNDYKAGFLAPAEHRRLRQLIENYFGSADAIRERFWTAAEKQEYDDAAAQAAANGGYMSVSGEPVSSGIEYVLQALCELDGRAVTLFTLIE